jgi:hypothetical protein
VMQRVAAVHVPEIIKELANHLVLISQAAGSVAWEQVAEYDLSVRYKKAEDPHNYTLGIMDSVAWNLAMGARVAPPRLVVKRSALARDANGDNTCRFFNKGVACRFQEQGTCMFVHACNKCGSTQHSGRFCAVRTQTQGGSPPVVTSGTAMAPTTGRQLPHTK